MKKRKKITQINSLNEVPRFKTEDEEREFWNTHGLSDKLWDKLYDPELEKKERKLEKNLRLTDRRKKKTV